MWEQYATYFADGIPYGDVISSVFIVALCAVGLIIARRMYGEL